MRVAIIVLVLNEAEQLPHLLHDLAHAQADEVIVVDGGSSDGTRAMLAAAALPWCESVAGRARQMNHGAAQVASDILLFLHADTRINASHLSAVRRTMADPQVVAGRFDVRLSGRHPLLRLVERMINLRSRLTRISTGDQAMFVRRSVFEHIGGFPDQPLMEDVALSRRLKREGKIACLRQAVTTSSRRWQRHGILRTVLLMWWLRLRYWLGTDPARLKQHYADHA